MLFSEVYSAYFNTIATIITEALDGELSEKRVDEIIRERAFSESILAILPALKNSEWAILNNDFQTPIKHKPKMPLTILQKRWLAEYYQTEGYNALCGHAQYQLKEVIDELKTKGQYKEIQSTMNRLKSQTAISVPKDLAYVEGSLFNDYIHDMKIMQQFAVLNRKAMVDTILIGMRLSAVEEFSTIHNYIDTEAMILRKGAVSAKAGEKLLIPINMRDGSLICIGKGNPDWNYSAPHGAGRLMSRSKALRELKMEQYQAEMSGIFSTCVLPETLDESPMAYKPIDEIIAQIEPTAEIVAKIKPLYNFKAAEKARGRR